MIKKIFIWQADQHRYSTAFFYFILFGLAIRFLYFFEHSRSPFFAIPLLDEAYYNQFARMLLSGADIRIFGGFRPLLYPFFLSLLYRLGGALSIEFSLLTQHMMGIATSLSIVIISARLFRSYWIGFLSGALYILSPIPLFFEGELLLETFYVFLISATLYLHARACQDPGRSRPAAWFICGAMTALTAQVHSMMLIFLGVYPIFSFYLFLRSRRREALIPLYALIGALCVLTMFGIINIRQSGKFQMIASQGGVTFYLCNKPNSDGMIPRQDRLTTYGSVYQDSVEIFAREEYRKAMLAEGRDPADDPSAISSYWLRRAFKNICQDPVRWLRLMLRKAWLLLWNFEITNNKSIPFFMEKESFMLRFLPVRWFILLALAPIGVMLARRSGDKNILFLILSFLALYSTAIVLFLVNSRYRLALWPAMTVLAGGGVGMFWSALRSRDKGSLFLYSAIIIGISFFSIVNWPGIEPPSYARDYYFRSIARYQHNQLDKALDDIRESLRLDPEDYKALLHYGNILFALNRYPEAKDVYLKVSAHDPREGRAWNNLGAAYEALKDYKRAYRAYLTARRLDAGDKRSLQNLILLELRAGLLEKAAKKIALLEIIDKDDVVNMSAKSFLENAQGHYDEGKSLELRAYAASPDTAAWAFGLLKNNPVSPADLRDGE